MSAVIAERSAPVVDALEADAVLDAAEEGAELAGAGLLELDEQAAKSSAAPTAV